MYWRPSPTQPGLTFAGAATTQGFPLHVRARAESDRRRRRAWAMDTAPALGTLAALSTLANTVPYVRDTVRRSTRPHRGTWLIWTVLAVVACLSQRADGATWSLVMCATQAVMNGVVLALALRLGTGAPKRAE